MRRRTTPPRGPHEALTRPGARPGYQRAATGTGVPQGPGSSPGRGTTPHRDAGQHEKQRLYELAINAARYQDGEAPQGAIVARVDLETYQAPAPRPEIDLPPPPRKPKVRKRLWWRGETCAEPDLGEPRAAASALEHWAAAGARSLSGQDPDRAKERNGVGWSASDGGYGHQFAAELEAFGGLTDRGWKACIALVRRYRRQVGNPPE